MIPSLYTSILYCWHNNNNNNKHGVYDGVIMTVIDTALSNITPRRLQYTAVGDATLKQGRRKQLESGGVHGERGSASL